MVGTSTLRRQLELVEWIEGGPEHRGEAKHGRASVEIIMAIYESARMHEVVQLPLRTHANPLDLMIAEWRFAYRAPRTL